MTDNELKDTVIRLAAPTVHALGLEIWGVEIGRAGRTLIRLFVDVPVDVLAPAPEADMAETSVTASIGCCEEISRRLGLALEVEDCIPDAYVLEVSTPGLSRLFFSPAQMRPFMGEVVEARLHLPAAPEGLDTASARRKTWRGRLTAVEDAAFVLAPVTVSVDGDVTPEELPPVHLPWEAVRRASRIYIFRAPVKPGKGKSGTAKPAAESTGKAAAKTAGKAVKAKAAPAADME